MLDVVTMAREDYKDEDFCNVGEVARFLPVEDRTDLSTYFQSLGKMYNRLVRS